MLDALRRIIKPKYQALNIIELLAGNLIDNLSFLSSQQPQAEMFPVLKSNAYGHGLKEVCQILNKSEVKMVALDSFPEAQIVYKHFRGRVLILSEMPLKAYRYCDFKRTEFVVYNDQTLKYLAKFASGVKIHLFLNTGMNREGIDDLNLFLTNNRKDIERVEVSGFCSHLAEAECSDSDFTSQQTDRFLEGLEVLRRHKIYPKWIHLGNSAGVFVLHNNIFNAFRPGLAFYGYNPFPSSNPNFKRASSLKPALRLDSSLVGFRRLKKGERVSYGRDFFLEEEANIALLPFGYFEGLDRRLSGRAKFLYKQGDNVFWAEVAGRIGMNICCLNCHNRAVEIGDRVNIISELRDMDNSIEKLSAKADMLSYEFLIRLNQTIKRKIIYKRYEEKSR